MVDVLELSVQRLCEDIKSSSELEREVNPEIPLSQQIPQFSSIDLYEIFREYGIRLSQLSHAEGLTEDAKAMVKYAVTMAGPEEAREILNDPKKEIDLRDVLRLINVKHIYHAIDYFRTNDLQDKTA